MAIDVLLEGTRTVQKSKIEIRIKIKERFLNLCLPAVSRNVIERCNAPGYASRRNELTLNLQVRSCRSLRMSLLQFF